MSAVITARTVHRTGDEDRQFGAVKRIEAGVWGQWKSVLVLTALQMPPINMSGIVNEPTHAGGIHNILRQASLLHH